MQIITIAGTVGRDSALRNAGGKDVLGFSVAVDNGKDKNGEKRGPTWYDCAIWGDRASKFERHIIKGKKLTLTGRPGVRVHEGKAYLQVDVNDFTFQGGGESNEGFRQETDGRVSGGGSDRARESCDLNDEIPF